MLLSRNFRQKSVRGNFRNFHTVPMILSESSKILLFPKYLSNKSNLIRGKVLVLLIIFRQIDMNFFYLTTIQRP